MGAHKVTVEIAQQRIRAMFGDIVTLRTETFVRVNKKALFVDVEYGEWWALPSNVFNGHGHPKRGSRITSCKIKAKKGLTIDKLQERLDKFELGLTFLHETFVGSVVKCCFIDPIYGEWWATPSNVIHRRTKHPERAKADRACTMFIRYGVDNPTKNQAIALKAARGSNTVTVMLHWRSGKQLTCVGSYEVAIIKWLNDSQLDYEWQPGPFSMPDGRTYRPDVFILSGAFANTYIEVKGYFRDDAREKWEWFHSEHPYDSQLWDAKKLKEMGLISTRRTKLITNETGTHR